MKAVLQRTPACPYLLQVRRIQQRAGMLRRYSESQSFRPGSLLHGEMRTVFTPSIHSQPYLSLCTPIASQLRSSAHRILPGDHSQPPRPILLKLHQHALFLQSRPPQSLCLKFRTRPIQPQDSPPIFPPLPIPLRGDNRRYTLLRPRRCPSLYKFHQTLPARLQFLPWQRLFVDTRVICWSR